MNEISKAEYEKWLTKKEADAEHERTTTEMMVLDSFLGVVLQYLKNPKSKASYGLLISSVVCTTRYMQDRGLEYDDFDVFLKIVKG